MRQRDNVTKLNEMEIEWPKYDPQFDIYRAKLRNVIDANFEPPVGKTLEYDDDEQVFWVTFRVGGMLAGAWGDSCTDGDKRTSMKLDRMFKIDPTCPIGPQIKAGLATVDEMQQRVTLLQVLLNNHLEQKEKA